MVFHAAVVMIHHIVPDTSDCNSQFSASRLARPSSASSRQGASGQKEYFEAFHFRLRMIVHVWFGKDLGIPLAYSDPNAFPVNIQTQSDLFSDQGRLKKKEINKYSLRPLVSQFFAGSSSFPTHFLSLLTPGPGMLIFLPAPGSQT